jgi:uncharacterized RDD family membrane protein YckC
MKAWQVRLVDHQGAPVSRSRALWRYLASWLWILPALGIADAAQWHDAARLCGTLSVWVMIYAASAHLQRDRQFWHDALCRTRLVRIHPAVAGTMPAHDQSS